MPFLIHEPISPVLTSATGSAQSTSKAPGKGTAPGSVKKPSSALSSTVNPSPTITIDVKEEELKGQIIHFWHPWSGPTKAAIDRLVETFNLENPWGILVSTVAFTGYDQLTERMESNLLTSSSPQVVAGLLYQALSWDRSRTLVDLQTYLFSPDWGFKPEEQEDFFPVFWEQNKVGGRMLGIPAFETGQVVYYNETWAKELGFQTPPVTTEQFRQQACAAAQANLNDDSGDNNGTGGLMVSSDPGALSGWIEAFGGSPVIDPGRTQSALPGTAEKTSLPASTLSIYQFNTAKNIDAFEFLRKLYDDGCAWQSQTQTFEELFARRQGLFSTGSVTNIPYLANAMSASRSQDEWTVLPFPSPSSAPAIVTSGPSYFLLPSTPQQQLAGWLFIRWLSDPDRNARLVESNGSLPARLSAIASLSQYKNRYPQWGKATELIKYAQSEPGYASWGKVRRALGDAATQLYRSYFSVDQIPAMLAYLDIFAAELHAGPDFGAIFITPTTTLKPGQRPARTPIPATADRP